MRIEKKIDNLINEKKYSGTMLMYDVKPTRKAVSAAKEIAKKTKDPEKIGKLLKDYLEDQEFKNTKSQLKFKFGVLTYLVQNNIISKSDADKIKT